MAKKNAKKTKAAKKAKKGMVAALDTFAPVPTSPGTIKGSPAFDSTKLSSAKTKAECQQYAAEAAAAGMSFFSDPCAAFNQTPAAPAAQAPALSMATPGQPKMASAKLTKYLAKAAPGLASSIGQLAGASAGLQSFLGDVSSGVAAAFGAEEVPNIPTDDETTPYIKPGPVAPAGEWIQGIPNVAVVVGAAVLGYFLFFRRK